MSVGVSPDLEPAAEAAGPPSPIGGRLEQQALARGAAVAVEAVDGVLTFDELAAAARNVHRALLADGGACEVVVVWMTPARARQVVAVLGALRSGIATLVVDPAAPEALVDGWVATLGPAVALTDPDHRATARRRLPGRRTVVVDELTVDTAPPPLAPADAFDWGGLIVPDGERLEWRSPWVLGATARLDARRGGLRAEDRVAGLLPLSSPLGVRTLLAAVQGSATFVVHDAPRRGWADLPRWLAAEGITVAAMTETTLELATTPAPLDVPSLRRVLLLGEAPPDPAKGHPRLAVPITRAATEAEVAEEVVAAAARAQPPDIATGGATIPDEDPLRGVLASIWRELLGVDAVEGDEDFFALGGHSLLAARMLVLLEQRTGVRLPMAVFLDTTTLDALAEAARAARDHPRDERLELIRHGDPARLPLFVTHDLQGSAWRFRALAAAIDTERPIFAFESPMLEGRRAAATIEDLADQYVDALRLVQPEGAVHLCGYSFGGILAFEMARRLHARGDEVALLGVIDVGPGYRGIDYSRTQLPPLPYLDDARTARPGEVPGTALVRRLWLNRWVLAARWRTRLRLGRGPIPPDERLWFAWWSHWSLVGPHWSAARYDGRIDLFWAETTPGTDATMGWGDHATDVVVHPVPGEHVHLMEPPAVEAIGAGLADLLRRT